MADLGSFNAPTRQGPAEHTITVCGEEFTVRPRFNALQSVQWAKAIKVDDGVAIGAYTGDIIASSMDKEAYARFEKVVDENEVDLTILAQIADALMTAALNEGTAGEERPTTKPSGSSPSPPKTSKRSKAASSLQDKRDERMREKGMVPISESQIIGQISNG
jgi:hypothetical protein